jgi:hypothetical protein
MEKTGQVNNIIIGKYLKIKPTLQADLFKILKIKQLRVT